eukprot:gene1812-33231_t
MHLSPSASWSTLLEAGAQEWADKLASQCSFEHGSFGESLYFSSASDSWSQVVESWYSEVAFYSFKNSAKQYLVIENVIADLQQGRAILIQV